MKKEMIKKIQATFVCLTLLCIAFTGTGCNRTSKVLNYLRKEVNTSNSRWWADFVEENGIDAMTSDGKSLLITAIRSDNVELTKLCIKAGADVTRHASDQRAPVIIASAVQQNPEITKMLIEAGAPIYIEDHYNVFGSMIAVYDYLRKPTYDETFDVVLDHTNSKELDYRKYRTLFENATFEQIQKLDAKGFKPCCTDAVVILEKYLMESDATKKAFYYSLYKKYMEDSFYSDSNCNFIEIGYKYYFIIDEAPKLVDDLLAHGYSISNKEGANPYKLLGDTCFGYMNLCESNSSYDEEKASKSNEHLTTLLNFFKKYSLDIKEGPTYSPYLDMESMVSFAHSLYEQTEEKVCYDCYIEMVRRLVSEGLNSVSNTDTMHTYATDLGLASELQFK